ncbi:hypothetical protein LC085_10840 [Bacillus tianshenii]|uniref:hypothetical protein n=1 Tax=Sutcliffiella tianshenii TaxID=1463404 RepID=UPI001CD206E5|nr:hypothetical protein [Bacillus tianshenii]MCA1320406.1 hypothetical protein [Bacillus tianshenii]
MKRNAWFWSLIISAVLVFGVGTYIIYQQLSEEQEESIAEDVKLKGEVIEKEVKVEVQEEEPEVKDMPAPAPVVKEEQPVPAPEPEKEEPEISPVTEKKEPESTPEPEKEKDSSGDLQDAQIKGVVKGLFEDIIHTYRELGAKHQWNNRTNPADFEILKPELLQYASTSFTNGHLKELAGKYYCECDAPLIPLPSMDIRFTVHENTSERVVASTIEFSNELHGDNGGTVYFTLIEENGKWVMDGWEKVGPDKEDMKVTWEEYEAYLNRYNEVTFLNEVTHNGEKVYVFFNHSANWLNAIYARSTNFINDIPVDWIPEEYRKPPFYLKGLKGSWMHEQYTGGLEIFNVDSNTFDFKIHVASTDGQVAVIEGMAVVDQNTGIFYTLDNTCQILFQLGSDSITVTENTGCSSLHGENISFEGVYRKEE